MDPPLGNGYDSEEVRLGPKSYQWTRTLLSDQKTTAPTRFDLFRVRKDFEAFLTAARRNVEANKRSECKGNGNGYDSEEVRLGPKSYQWTRSLLSDQKTTAPTRFDLFRTRKQFEAFLTAARRNVEANKRSELKYQQIHQMHTTLLECAKLYQNKLGPRQAIMEKIEKLVESKVLTRSMTAKIEKLESDNSDISNELFKTIKSLNELTKVDNLGRLPELFVEWGNSLNDRILATAELRDQVLHYLEH